ncbi:unnamed protein product [Ectocarpus fasciculatus]
MRGVSYWLNGNLYVSVTNRVISASPVLLRGPSFVMPPESGFCKLEKGGDESVEPSIEEICEAVDHAFETGKVAVSSMDSEPVTFAGYGEPLLRLDCICDAVERIKEHRHGASVRVKTSGLILSSEGGMVANKLKEAGIERVSVSLVSDNPQQFQDIMQPSNGAKFGDVCSFIISCAEVGLDVECTAVERPDVKISNVRSLALALGATGFRSVKYFP